MATSSGSDARTETREVDTLIVNALVVCMDASFRVFDNGAVAIAGDTIREVGPTDTVRPKYIASRTIDAHNKLVLPGLINAHTHAPMTIFRGFADDLYLNEWLYDYIFPVEQKFLNSDNVAVGTRLAIAEMLRSGTTMFNDMYYYSDTMAEEIDSIGIRAILSEALFDTPSHNGRTTREVADRIERIMEHWRGHPRIHIAVAAHAPYTASPAVYQQASNLARKHNTLLHTHLAETRWEVDTIMEKYGHTPVQHLEKIGVLGPELVVAHAIHLTGRDMELMASRDVAVAHNPQCNMKLANGVAPIPELLKRGVRVGIGTDGVASNNDHDLFDEIRSSALAHKLVSGDPTVMDARTVLEAVTLGGARALGLERNLGSLEAGKQADIIIVDLDQPHAQPWYNIYSHIVYSLRGSDVETVMVDGRILMEQGTLHTIDTERLYDRVREIKNEICSWRDNKQ